MVLLPYTMVNGAYTLPDAAMVEVFRRMKEEDRLRRLFSAGGVRQPGQFLRFMKDPQNVVHTVWDENDLLAILWLNDFTGCSAFGHVCMFRSARKKTIEIGKLSFAHWFKMVRPDGTPLLNVVMAKIPVPNRAATIWIRKVGMTILGTVPNFAWNGYTKQYDGAVLAYKENDHGRE